MTIVIMIFIGCSDTDLNSVTSDTLQAHSVGGHVVAPDVGVSYVIVDGLMAHVSPQPRRHTPPSVFWELELRAASPLHLGN